MWREVVTGVGEEEDSDIDVGDKEDSDTNVGEEEDSDTGSIVAPETVTAAATLLLLSFALFFKCP